MSMITNDVNFTPPYSTNGGSILSPGFSSPMSSFANSDFYTASQCSTPEGSVHLHSPPPALPHVLDISVEYGPSRPCSNNGMISATPLNGHITHQPQAKIAVSNDMPSLLSQHPLTNGDNHFSFSPLARPPSFAISNELTDSKPCSRSSMISANLFNPQKSHQIPAKSAVSNDIPSLLTHDILNIGDVAHSRYEVARELHPPEDSELLLRQNPFSNFSCGAMEAYFAAAVDTKNALQLRQSVVAVDIGEILERLLPKLSLYVQDGAVLETAFEELRLIEEASSKKGFSLNFFNLEFHHYMLPSHVPSVLEQHSSLFSEVQYHLNEKDDAQQAARTFIDDPHALQEC